MTESTPYTYLIGWSELDLWYYGVRYAKECSPDDLWKRYFTSSKYVSEMRKVQGEPDVIRVARVFKTREQACKHELKFLTRVGVPGNRRFLNRARNDSYHAVHTGMTGMTHTAESKKLMSLAQKLAWETKDTSYLLSHEYKAKLAAAAKKPKDPLHVSKIIASSHIGRKAAVKQNTGKSGLSTLSS